ncbi:hypothetical protein PENSPDRAFT_643007 [Peniophora sp. CONT]|nr:hypothetical protein PENSPDRAFT_643007 [Peniophora sp. CONT]
MSLDAHIDRLSHAARTIRDSSSSLTPLAEPGPFTRALLEADITDLVRDIDPSEIGLFTLVQPPIAPRAESNTAPPPEVARIDIVSATPLRKPPAPRPDAPRGGAPGEHEPEVYARAALNFIDKYASIRPMPRARAQVVAMLEQLEEIRVDIHSLNDALRQANAGGSSKDGASAHDVVEKEKRRIQELQNQVKEMQQRKEDLQRKRPSTRGAPSPRKPLPKRSPRKPMMQKNDLQEDSFWATPASRMAPAPRSGGMLMDESFDVANITASFDSPLAHRTPSARAGQPAGGFLRMGALGASDDVSDEDGEELHPSGDEIEEEPELEEEEETEDATVVLSKPPPPEPPVSSPAPDDSSSLIDIEPTEPLPAAIQQTPSKSRVRVTSELERIVTRIWSTVGDIIMPRNPYSVDGDNKPPRAKVTIAHLKEVASQTPQPTSPSSSSLTSTSQQGPTEVTPQQVLTAQMLLALLSAPPSFSLPLNEVKKALGVPVGAGPRASAVGAGALATRVLYGCVAKRLIKIERGGGEQVVRFDLS